MTIQKISGQKGKVGLLAHFDEIIYPQGKVQFPGSESIVSHHVVRFHVNGGLQIADGFGVRVHEGAGRKEKIARFHKDELGPFVP